jgi:uncharacterized protein
LTAVRTPKGTRAEQSLSTKLASFERALAPAELELLRTLLDGSTPGERLRNDVRLLTASERALVDELRAEAVDDSAPASAASHFVTLIVKGTRLCNLRCSYCHDWRTGKDQRMPFAVLARVVACALRDPSHRIVNFIWHGGETTVLPIAFYDRAFLLQSYFRRPGQLIRNSIQTNGTRITPEWARFLRVNDVSVGVSLDGPRAIHDRYRRYASGRGSFDDVLAGMNMLQEYGVDHSVLMVIDDDAYALGPDPIFSFFVDRGIKSFGLLAAKPTNEPDAAPGTPAAHYVDPTRFNAFLAEMYDLWLAHGDPSVRIRELEVIRQRLAQTSHRPCTLSGGCIGNYFLVEPNGDLAHCDLFLGDPAYTVGNVASDTFAQVRGGDRVRSLAAENAAAVDRLRTCPDFAVCNGWCPHERYISRRHNPNHSDDCCGLRSLIDHIRRHPAPWLVERRAREQTVSLQ